MWRVCPLFFFWRTFLSRPSSCRLPTPTRLARELKTGKLRLSKWYSPYTSKEEKRIVREVSKDVLARPQVCIARRVLSLCGCGIRNDIFCCWWRREWLVAGWVACRNSGTGVFFFEFSSLLFIRLFMDAQSSRSTSFPPHFYE